jgi:uncharacterized protein YbaR (Trm112 family)
MSADLSQKQFELNFTELREMLACPACHGELRFRGERVMCESCGREYPIVEGIPVLIAEKRP